MSTHKLIISFRFTGIPAGKKRSKLCTGITKQSRSKVDNEIGSFRVPTVLLPPLKLTENNEVIGINLSHTKNHKNIKTYCVIKQMHLVKKKKIRKQKTFLEKW